ncbi:PP2C family protein-serine/threonine phosphatase [Streptomyces sp. RB6PN23]|uniref:PP2C family protein-serine/threonine phosphatase n=1 Tax=Streptomyces silvisoli TaxID=3034235 RepID=A0ABT5ZX13_9ACTN|nr:PP2C family protein-serine/threonine phosphatase [Streptomyces silvisoli]
MGQPWQTSRAWLALPVVLVVLITVVDIRSPTGVHLGPALVIAPAVTAFFAGPRTTGSVGVLALAAQVVIAVFHGGLTTTNHIVQMITLAVLSALVVSLCVVRERQGQELAQVRSVAEAAQHVLLWPLPEHIGPLRVACLYLAAEEEARIGGDLYAATRTDTGVRVMIGDVRGKGLSAIGEAALLLGAFREAAHQHTTLPALAAALERSVTRYLTDFEPTEEVGERFATTLLMEIPDSDHITRMTSCGHPPPLLLTPGGSAAPLSLHPAPPLGVGLAGPAGYTLDVFTFQPGDTLLLYTDGVTEARDADGAFYPIAERAARWTEHSPETLLSHLRRDLLAHVGGRLGDDAALIALHRTPTTHPGHHPGKTIHADGFRHRP